MTDSSPAGMLLNVRISTFPVLQISSAFYPAIYLCVITTNAKSLTNAKIYWLVFFIENESVSSGMRRLYYITT